MFQTEGPLDPESPLFIGREQELKHMADWLVKADCVGAVSGPRQVGKTSLLLRWRHDFRAKYRFVFVDLEAVVNATAGQCYEFVCREILDQLADQLPSNGNPCPACDSIAFLEFLRQVSQNVSAVRVAIILDEIGALPRDASITLAHTIRAVLSSRHVRPEYKRFIFVLSGSSDMKRFTTDKVSPLRNVIDCVYLGDLSADEADQLLVRGFEGYDTRISEEVRRRIFHWTDGHPYLTQLIGERLIDHSQRTNALPNSDWVDEIVHDVLETEDKNLPHMRRLLDKGSPTLWGYVTDILKGRKIRFSRSSDDLAELELLGVIKAKDGMCVIRNRIYEEALSLWQKQNYKTAPEGSRTRSGLRGLVIGWLAALSPRQRIALLGAVAALVLSFIPNWTDRPVWLPDWVLWCVAGVAVLAFIVIAVIQAREGSLRAAERISESGSRESDTISDTDSIG